MTQTEIKLDDQIKDKLLPYQVIHTENLIYSLKIHDRACDVSDTGTGKSYTAIASILCNNCIPFIVCPKSVLSTWTNVVKHFGAKCYGYSNYEMIQNCKYYTDVNKQLKIKCPYIERHDIKNNKTDDDKKSNTYDYIYEWKNIPNDMIIVYDEVHRCKNSKTVNHNILLSLTKAKAKILMLSATICDKPENFALCGHVLKLYDHINDAKKWISNVGKEYENPMHGVHDEIFPEYCSRMRVRDLGKLFPDNQVLADCYDMIEYILIHMHLH